MPPIHPGTEFSQQKLNQSGIEQNIPLNRERKSAFCRINRATSKENLDTKNRGFLEELKKTVLATQRFGHSEKLSPFLNVGFHLTLVMEQPYLSPGIPRVRFQRPCSPAKSQMEIARPRYDAQGSFGE